MSIEIEIDGKVCLAEPGEMVIEVADREGITIPRFCYHKKLSIAANCRMCLVEMVGGRKPIPACATPVAKDMQIKTQSEAALRSQRYVMEFLLINHPLDCPICDQGGECELQDVAMGFGRDVSRFNEGKRAVEDDNLGTLIATEMTRCIHCTRCIRFGTEIAGVPELGMTGRGEHARVTTYIEQSLRSEVSGNVIDLCPVGALTSKPYRFTARSWEMEAYPSIAPHDCLGTHIDVHVRRGQVMRVVPRENEAINETWISDRDRFSYTGLSANKRLLSPCIKQDGVWQECSWEVAFDYIYRSVSKVLQTGEPGHVGGLISPSASIEAQYLFQRLLRGLGCHNIDHRVRQTDFSQQVTAPLYPKLPYTLAEVETAPSILLVGSDIQREQPLLALRVRKAALNGADIAAVNPLDFDFHFALQARCIVSPNRIDAQLAEIAAVLLTSSKIEAPASAVKLLANVKPNADAHAIAARLQPGGVLLLGELAQNHSQAARLYALAELIAELAGLRFGVLTPGANTAGAWLAGCIPHRGAVGKPLEVAGLDAAQMMQTPRRAYFLYGIEPSLDMANPRQAQQALSQAELVVGFTAYHSPHLADVANVLLPIAPFTETAGTYVNVTGAWQSFTGVAAPQGASRPGWKVLRVLGNVFLLPEFDYLSADAVRDELKTQVLAQPYAEQVQDWQCPTQLNGFSPGLMRIADWPIYRGDMLVRRAEPLQHSGVVEPVAARIHPELAERLGVQQGTMVRLEQGGGVASLPIAIDVRVPDGAVWVSAGLEETQALGQPFAPIELQVIAAAKAVTL